MNASVRQATPLLKERGYLPDYLFLTPLLLKEKGPDSYREGDEVKPRRRVPIIIGMGDEVKPERRVPIIPDSYLETFGLGEIINLAN